MDPLLQSAFATGYERLAAWADLLDEINVYPVADADTGRNLMISLAPLHRMDASVETTVRKLLVSATGNSGNIASGFFAGFVAENPSKDIYQATRVGRDRAWQAIADPKPGTMLTVFDELLRHLENLSSDPSAATSTALIDRLEKAVHSTSETLPALKAAGVVDSGALGVFIFMEGFFSRLAGRADVFRPITGIFSKKLRLPSDFKADYPKGYCVDAVVHVGKEHDPALESLSRYGGSIVALQENERLKIHIHTEQRDAVRKQLADLGRVVQWSEEDMGAQAAKRPDGGAQPVIHIVTDAAGSITREDAARLGMTLLDSYILVGDKSLPETLFPPEELYALMRSGVRVTTAQASVFERHQRWQSILGRYGQALYLCVGSVYTGNYEIVAAWKERHDPDNRLSVIDTGLASGRLGVAALATARYAIQADDAEKVFRFAESAVRKSREYIFLDRLQYLVAGGRLSKTKGFLGDLFHLKPVITPTAEGAVKAGTVRDKDEQIKFALGKLEKGLGPDTQPLIMIEYSDNRQWVENNVLGEIKSRYASAEIILQPLSLTSGAHMGPGTWAVAFLPSTLQ
ncbi:MAG TPA: DegV family protein [Desulfobacterales bacterium]|nr:DegV family protein [Desulfobacterales bacterium]